jgi:uncharacterized protein YjbJ (UPF0337 family)
MIKGGADRTKGAVKEKAGKVIGDRARQDRGTAEKVSGQVREKAGELKKFSANRIWQSVAFHVERRRR